jgi:hypothetical protein
MKTLRQRGRKQSAVFLYIRNGNCLICLVVVEEFEVEARESGFETQTIEGGALLRGTGERSVSSAVGKKAKLQFLHLMHEGLDIIAK